ncbi:MAG: 2-oxoglutarate-dependent dioxygenase [Burkholderiales bacterium]|nr:MAG: 2-oxoglutarate-dependent dioxygenase [Betaproteobacteria bacterium]TAG82837.1 MAG: 2-oxoglutarate-dependent dioxygenase [Burkholderiales bacterium]
MQIDANLMKWLNECLARGHSPESLTTSMLQSGWSQEMARLAIAEALGKELRAQPSLPAATKSVPEPSIAQSPVSIQTSDRRIDVWTVVKHPRVVVFGNVLSHDECDELILLAQPKLSRSLTVDNQTGGDEVNPARTSDGMFFVRGENPLCERIERRLAELVNWPYEHGEGLQVLRYKHGAQYVPHYDYFDPAQPGTPKILQRGGQRVGTIVMYLRTPERGGSTVFPDIGLEVAPIKGSAVFFSYDRPHPDTKTLHGGTPVTLGEKYVATKWMREGPFH